MKPKRSHHKSQDITTDEDKSLGRLFGTDKQIIVDGLLRHCISVLSNEEANGNHKGNDEHAFIVAIIAEIKPRDGVERMLAVQMAAMHVAMIRSGRWLSRSENLPQAQTHTNG